MIHEVVDAVFAVFRKKAPAVPTVAESKAVVPAGFIAPQTAGQLLNTPRRQKYVAHIWQRTSLSRAQFEWLYLQPIERYAALVQQFPASEAHHHAYMGGMLDHGLEIVAYALKLRQSHLLPIGASPETQAAQAEVWMAGVAYAALLHDLGKVAVDLHVEYEDGRTWHPWYGPITQPYRFQYVKNREYRLHSASTSLLYHQIIDASILDWLSQTPELWAALLYVLAGQFEHAGIVGEIVTRADQASVAQELGGDPAKAMAAPKHALQRKLLDGLRYLVKEELKLNNAGPSDGWLTDEALWLVSKTVSDKLRAHLLSQGVSGIPAKNSAIFDVMQEHAILQPTAQDKAIWSATVRSDESGWSNTFTFLKISPALIWEPDNRPQSFTGSVTASIENADDVGEVKNTAATKRREPGADETLQQTAVQSVKPVPAASQALSADSLDAVFDLLGLDDVTPSENISTDIPQIPDMPDLDTTSITTAEPVVLIKPVKTAKTATPKKPAKARTVAKKPSDENVQPAILAPETPQTSEQAAPAINDDPVTFSGEHFMQWLKGSILSQKLTINDPLALVHTVEDTLYIVTPGIFMRYSQEFPQIQPLANAENLPAWRWAQRQFEHLKIHKKQANGLNIWTCNVSIPQQNKTKKVHGYLLAHPEIILPEILFNNPYLTINKNHE